MSMMGLTKWPFDEKVRNRLQRLRALREKQMHQLTNRELLHVAAVEEWYTGNLEQASKIWDQIAQESPMDVHALRLMYDACYLTGNGERLVDSFSRVMPIWEAKKPPLMR